MLQDLGGMGGGGGLGLHGVFSLGSLIRVSREAKPRRRLQKHQLIVQLPIDAWPKLKSAF